MLQPKPKIFILSAGSLVGQNILECLASRRNRFELVAVNSHAKESSLYEFDRVYLSPETTASAFKARVLELLEQETPDLICSGRDDDVVFLAELAESEPRWARHCLGQGLQAARIMQDKWLSYQWAVSEGLPFVPSIMADHLDPLKDFALKQGFPLLGKPRAGFASKGIYLITTPQQLQQITELKGYLVQKYWDSAARLEAFLEQQSRLGLPLFFSFESPKYSLQTFISGPESWSEPFLTRHQMRNGFSMEVSCYQDAALTELGQTCARAFAANGWRGPLNIQGQYNAEQVFGIYEFNGRFTGATAARYYLGFDEVGQALQQLLGFELEPVMLPAASQVSKQFVARALIADQVNALTQAACWSRI